MSHPPQSPHGVIGASERDPDGDDDGKDTLENESLSDDPRPNPLGAVIVRCDGIARRHYVTMAAALAQLTLDHLAAGLGPPDVTDFIMTMEAGREFLIVQGTAGRVRYRPEGRGD